MPLSDIAYPLGILLVALAVIYVLLLLVYRRGRQV